MALPTRIAPAPGDTTTSRASWLMLTVLLLGQFMCIIDVLVTNVAMPSIAASQRGGATEETGRAG